MGITPGRERGQVLVSFALTLSALLAVIGVNIWLGIPFNTTILYSGLQSVPQELYEAGALDEGRIEWLDRVLG